MPAKSTSRKVITLLNQRKHGIHLYETAAVQQLIFGVRMTEKIDPEDDPFRRRLLFFISVLIVGVALLIMEWWSGYGVECTTDLVCDCYPRGIRCWFAK